VETELGGIGIARSQQPRSGKTDQHFPSKKASYMKIGSGPLYCGEVGIFPEHSRKWMGISRWLVLGG